MQFGDDIVTLGTCNSWANWGGGRGSWPMGAKVSHNQRPYRWISVNFGSGRDSFHI